MTRDPKETVSVKMTVEEARRVANILMAHYSRVRTDVSTQYRNAFLDKNKSEQHLAAKALEHCEELLETAIRFREVSK